MVVTQVEVNMARVFVTKVLLFLDSIDLGDALCLGVWKARA